MKIFRGFLLLSWVLIISITVYAVIEKGFNWPVIYFGDLVGHPWRSQFNTDFLIHLLLLASWVYWREESKVKGVLYGFLSIVGGGMFGFMYILVASVRSQGDAKQFFLGVNNKA